MHPNYYVTLPPHRHTHTLTQALLSRTLLHPDTLCVHPLQAWASVSCEKLVRATWCDWADKKRVKTAKRETKLAVASVSGVVSPWVRWAILIEGRRRSPAPSVHKPLYRIPHHVLTASWDCGGGVIQWQVWERKMMLSFTLVDFFVVKWDPLSADKLKKN